MYGTRTVVSTGLTEARATRPTLGYRPAALFQASLAIRHWKASTCSSLSSISCTLNPALWPALFLRRRFCHTMPLGSIRTVCVGSPSLAGHRGLKDPEVAKYLGNTLHYWEDECLVADSCAAVSDTITNLTRAMSDGLYQVQYHSPTSKAPSYRNFLLQVRVFRHACSVHSSAPAWLRFAVCRS